MKMLADKRGQLKARDVRSPRLIKQVFQLYCKNGDEKTANANKASSHINHCETCETVGQLTIDCVRNTGKFPSLLVAGVRNALSYYKIMFSSTFPPKHKKGEVI